MKKKHLWLFTTCLWNFISFIHQLYIMIVNYFNLEKEIDNNNDLKDFEKVN